MKNIAIIIDIYSSGGKEHMSVSVCNHLNKIKNYNFLYITTYKHTKKILDNKLNTNTLFFNKRSLLNRFKNRIKKLFNFLPLDYPFQSFLKKNKVDLVYFLDSSSLVNNISDIKFIYTILDIGHRGLEHLSEYKQKSSNNRDNDYYLAGKNSNKIIVGTKKIKKQISDIYNIDQKKIFELKFPPVLTNIKNNEFFEVDKNILNIKKTGKYFIYPAQFWEHKNHIYIVKAIEYLKHLNQLDFKMIFTGDDKGNLSNIKNLIKKKNLEDKFIIFDYVKDEELVYLYKNCSCVIIPTLVAPHTFPLYEAFFFKKPVIYNKSILDDELIDKVIGLDINKIENFKQALDILKDKNFIDKLVKDNFDYYEKTFDINKKTKILSELLKNSLNE